MDRISRSEKRQARQQRRSAKRSEEQKVKNTLVLKTVRPITKNQEIVFRDFSNGKNMFIHGYPGTGKSFLSVYLALNEIEKYREFEGITIIRSAVATRDQGFLKGGLAEKGQIFEQPYIEICQDLYGRGDAYEVLKKKGILDFQTTSYLRSLTRHNRLIIVDECQNMTFQELDTCITRAGEGSRVLFCGDFGQNDLNKRHDFTGILDFMNIIKKMHKHFSFVEMGVDDIVRSGLVKDYIIKKIDYYDKSTQAHTNNQGIHAFTA